STVAVNRFEEPPLAELRLFEPVLRLATCGLPQDKRPTRYIECLERGAETHGSKVNPNAHCRCVGRAGEREMSVVRVPSARHLLITSTVRGLRIRPRCPNDDWVDS